MLMISKINIYIYIYLSITNRIIRYTVFFITVNALHVLGRVSAHHQELENCTHSIRYMLSLLAATASGICQACLLLPLAVTASKLGIYLMLCVQFFSSG